MRRRQLIGVGATALTVPVISARTRQESSSDLLEVVDYAIGGDDPNEESITLQNSSGEPLELSNWRVEDDGLVPAETLSPFVFPSGFTLAPAESVTIVTGEGDDTTETLSWGVGRQIWSEDGDVVYVYDETGTLVLEQSIGRR